MRRLLPVAIAAVFLLPSAASAAQITKLDFRNGQTAGRWQISSSDAVTASPDGLVVKPKQDMIMYRIDPLPHRTDVMEVAISTPVPLRITFLWHPRSAEQGQFVQLPIDIPAAPGGHTMMLPLDRFPQWDPYSDQIGFHVPGGTQFVLAEIRLHRFTFIEKLTEMWRSFWSFDVFTRYTINFLWGPLIAFTPQTRMDLFSQLPPLGWSVNRILYPVFLIIAAAAGVFAVVRRTQPSARKTAAWIIAGSFAAMWLVFDLRMGLEILSYVKTDYRTYVTRPIEQKEFRYMADFHAVLQQVKPHVEGESRIGFISEPQLLLDTSVTYEFYPAEMVLPGEPGADEAQVWLVYLRRDIVLDSKGRLAASDGTVLTPPGRVIGHFGKNALLFSTAPEA